MIEVLKRGDRHRITCPECGSLLAYWEADVRYTGDYRFINCPVCKSEIKIPKSEDSESGEWERLGENATVCSKCGKGLQDSHGYGFVLNEFTYCPFCGRAMKVRENDESEASGNV